MTTFEMFQLRANILIDASRFAIEPTDGQVDRQTERLTDRQTGRERETERERKRGGKGETDTDRECIKRTALETCNANYQESRVKRLTNQRLITR